MTGRPSRIGRRPGSAACDPCVYLDVTRLFRHQGRAAPTGIDRVELAYAEHFIDCRNGPTRFIVLGRTGTWIISPQAVSALIARLKAHWTGHKDDPSVLAERLDWPHLAARDPRRAAFAPAATRAPSQARRGSPAFKGRLPLALAAPPPIIGRPPLYLNVSHQGLDDARRLGRLKDRLRARMVFLVHDTIPATYPEYARPGHDARHRARLETVATLADRVLVNSEATRDDLRDMAPRLRERTIPVTTIPLWQDDCFVVAPPPLPPSGRPYFIMVGTIEARKNHALLLSLWRDVLCRIQGSVPALVLVGRRGWECDTALALLDRCPTLREDVIEAGAVGDTTLVRLVSGARALLMPSFAEGFGLPVPEALAVRTPVIASDLPALRAAGQDVPEFLAPLDGPGWHAAIEDYADPGGSRRRRQLARMDRFRIRTKRDHLEEAMATLMAHDHAG